MLVGVWRNFSAPLCHRCSVQYRVNCPKKSKATAATSNFWAGPGRVFGEPKKSCMPTPSFAYRTCENLTFVLRFFSCSNWRIFFGFFRSLRFIGIGLPGLICFILGVAVSLVRRCGRILRRGEFGPGE